MVRRDPIRNNNTYILENEYSWKGIMIEYEKKFLESYIKHRPKSIHIMNDATKIDYKELFKNNNVPLNIDYLQIDIEVDNGSTLEVLKKLDNEIMDEYKFAAITFEHDIYNPGKYKNTRNDSRDIFKKHGYICVFEDINDNNPRKVFEDWYIHPKLVNMKYVKNLIQKNNSRI